MFLYQGLCLRHSANAASSVTPSHGLHCLGVCSETKAWVQNMPLRLGFHPPPGGEEVAHFLAPGSERQRTQRTSRRAFCTLSAKG